MKNYFLSLFILISLVGYSQNDSLPLQNADTVLRIIDLNPYFSIHVDSTFSYLLHINKSPENYFWYLKNAPVGLRISKDNGLITFKADRSYFLSGKLKYDIPYKVNVGVQNLHDPKEKTDTSFTIVFFNTEIILSKVKPGVNGTVWIDEGDSISFKVLCEEGSYPIDNILTLTNVPLTNYKIVQKCGDDFSWMPSYDFVKETDTGKIKTVFLYFIGSGKFQMKDTATVKLIVRNALNYPLAKEQYNQVEKELSNYIIQLKYTFVVLDKSIKKTKSTRTGFDLTSAGTALTGTVLSTSDNSSSKRTGTILPSIGLALAPIKEATAPTKTTEQNQASLLRSSIKRLEYILQDNVLVGEKDPQISEKISKLREELKQSQLQLIDVPLEITNNMSGVQLNRYFNSPRVNKKYRLKTK